jgi:hypothetical protein
MSYGWAVYDSKGKNRAVFTDTTPDLKIIAIPRLIIPANQRSVSINLDSYSSLAVDAEVIGPLMHYHSSFYDPYLSSGEEGTVTKSVSGRVITFTHNWYTYNNVYIDVMIFRLL